MTRRNFTMTQEQLDKLLDACKPVRMMKIGGRWPTSPQENANRAWAALGKEMGFDHMTVNPNGFDQKNFTAEGTDEEKE